MSISDFEAIDVHNQGLAKGYASGYAAGLAAAAKVCRERAAKIETNIRELSHGPHKYKLAARYQAMRDCADDIAALTPPPDPRAGEK